MATTAAAATTTTATWVKIVTIIKT